MSGKLQIEMIPEGVREIMGSDEVASGLFETANELAFAANGAAIELGADTSLSRAEYTPEVDTHAGSRLAIGHVWTNQAATRQDKKYGTLKAAIEKLQSEL